MTFATFLVIVAVIFFFLAAFGVGLPRFHFGWGGLAILTIAVWLIPVLH